MDHPNNLNYTFDAVIQICIKNLFKKKNLSFDWLKDYFHLAGSVQGSMEELHLGLKILWN